MSPFNSNMISSGSKLLQSWACCFFICSMIFPSVLRAGLLSQEAMSELKTRLLAGLDVREVTSVISGIESDVRSGGEGEKLAAINQSIELAAAVLSTVDQTVPLPGTVLRTPNLESLGPKGKRIFAGSDPESVQDPALRAAYKKLIQENDELLIKVGIEREKYDASDYALQAASRIIETSSNRTNLFKSVQQQIGSMSAGPWVKEKLLSALIPDNATRPNSNLPSPSKYPQNSSESVSGKIIEEAPEKIGHQPLAESQAHTVSGINPDSGVGREPRPIWPWIVTGAALAVAAWWMFRRRS